MAAVATTVLQENQEMLCYYNEMISYQILRRETSYTTLQYSTDDSIIHVHIELAIY